jgi:hypothetical protein
MTEQEALERIKQEYPEFAKQAEQDIKDGVSVKELLSVLDSFY